MTSSHNHSKKYNGCGVSATNIFFGPLNHREPAEIKPCVQSRIGRYMVGCTHVMRFTPEWVFTVVLYGSTMLSGCTAMFSVMPNVLLHVLGVFSSWKSSQHMVQKN